MNFQVFDLEFCYGSYVQFHVVMSTVQFLIMVQHIICECIQRKYLFLFII